MQSNPVMSFDQAQAYLDELLDALPQAYVRSLNGGVILVPDTMPSPHSQRGDLFTLGMYHYEPQGMGRYITIYYGTFVTIYGRESLEKQRNVLEEVLRHELTHHLESLAGERDLEIEDQEFLEKYRRGEHIDRHG